MRPFSAAPLDFNGSDSFRFRAKSSPKITPEEISRIKSDALEGADLSSTSIDEFKRIEAFLTSNPDSILKEFGVHLGRLEKTRDASDFNTASFISKEEHRFSGLVKANQRNNGRNGTKVDFIPFGDFTANILNGYGGISSQDIPSQQTSSQKSPVNKATFKERLELLKAQKKTTASILSRRETEGERVDTDSTFGIKRILRGTDTGMTTKHVKFVDNKPVLSESPISRGDFKKEKQQPKFERQSEPHYYCDESSLDVIEADMRIKNVFLNEKQNMNFQSMAEEAESDEIDSFLKHLMVPRRMKISIGGVPFQDVIFVLALKFFDKSSNFENFIFEWSDVKTGAMIGYIKCDFIKYVHKQSPKRFNIACHGSNEESIGQETLHHVHIETEAPIMCDLYVNGLNAVAKYMQRGSLSPHSKGF